MLLLSNMDICVFCVVKVCYARFVVYMLLLQERQQQRRRHVLRVRHSMVDAIYMRQYVFMLNGLMGMCECAGKE